MSTTIFKTVVGLMALKTEGDAITRLWLPERLPELEHASPSDLATEAVLQINAYLAGKLRDFQLPLSPAGTPFQMRVWHILNTIPYGTTVSYQDVARDLGNPKATRAVGMANNRNQIPIIIPCHRVVGKSGALTGYGGGLSLKQHLLELERRVLRE